MAIRYFIRGGALAVASISLSKTAADLFACCKASKLATYSALGRWSKEAAWS